MKETLLRQSRIGSFLLLALFALAPAAFGQSYRVLLVGDSWAELMWINGTMDTMFVNNGRLDLLAKGDATALSGTKASDWATAPYLQTITDELDANPSIEVVQLLMGGNDFLAGISSGGWYQGMTGPQQDALFAAIVSDIEIVVDHILAHDPSLQVLISSYDYANFVESLSGPMGAFCTNYWNDLGMPTPEEVNTAGTELEDLRQAMTVTRPRVTSVRHYGLMHWVFGYPSQSIPPGTLNLPGDITLPSPPEAMLLGADCTHLNEDGYYAVAQRLWDEYYVWHFSRVFTDGFESGDTSLWSSTVP